MNTPVTSCIDLRGAALADRIRGDVARRVTQLRTEEVTPGLALVMMGDDPVVHRQIDLKKTAAEESELYCEKHALPEMAAQATLNDLLAGLSDNPDIHAVFVQLPLPRHINRAEAGLHVAPEKDVDLLSPVTLGHFYLGHSQFQPALPAAVVKLLRHYEIRIKGADVAILGLGELASLPLSLMLTREQATVTVCHKATRNLADRLSSADILISALFEPRFVRWDMVGEGAVVLDCGQSTSGSRVVGDVDEKAVRTKARALTPVPGGLGPVIVATLLESAVAAADRYQAASSSEVRR